MALQDRQHKAVNLVRHCRHLVLYYPFSEKGMAYLEKAWERVKIVVLVQVAWMIVYAITMAWGILAGGITADAWPPTIIGAVFAVLLTILYIREEKIKK